MSLDPDPSTTDNPEATLIAEGAPDHELIHGGRLGLTMFALMLTMFLAALDQTIVSTALPRITSDLNGLGQLSWVVTAYLLASTASTPIWGKISDLYGRKIMLQAAIIIFLVGSLLAGASTSMGMLIVTRGIQGLGGGGLIVLVMAVIADVIPPRDRGKYTGLFGAVFAVASIAGPLLGGFFVDSLTWRWIFYINIPVGIAAFLVITTVLQVPKHKVQHVIDYLGAALLVIGVCCLLLIFEWGGARYSWTSPQIIGMTLLTVALLLAFVLRQLRVSEPIVPMALFRNGVFRTTSVIGFIVGLAMFGAIVFMPLFLQVVQGATPTEAGLELLPMMAGLLVASIVSGRLISRLGRYKIFPRDRHRPGRHRHVHAVHDQGRHALLADRAGAARPRPGHRQRDAGTHHRRAELGQSEGCRCRDERLDLLPRGWRNDRHGAVRRCDDCASGVRTLQQPAGRVRERIADLGHHQCDVQHRLPAGHDQADRAGVVHVLAQHGIPGRGADPHRCLRVLAVPQGRETARRELRSARGYGRGMMGDCSSSPQPQRGA